MDLSLPIMASVSASSFVIAEDEVFDRWDKFLLVMIIGSAQERLRAEVDIHCTFCSCLIRIYKANPRVLSTQHSPDWAIFLNSISSADVSVSQNDY